MSRISVVIPYYNSEKTILRALKSVVSQSYRDIEIILVDDGSVDNSSKIVDEFINENRDIRIVNIHQGNMGPSCARNTGIKKAAGEYIAFLDSDDEWISNKLEIQLNTMEKNSIDMLGCNYNLVKNDETQKFTFTDEPLKRISFRELIFKHYYATPCVMVKRKVLIDSGLFPENQRFMEDAYLFTNIARKYKACMTNDYLVNIFKMPFGEKGLSGQLNQMEKYELLNFWRFIHENDKYENRMGITLFISAAVFSIMKYIRRKIIVSLRNK